MGSPQGRASDLMVRIGGDEFALRVERPMLRVIALGDEASAIDTDTQD